MSMRRVAPFWVAVSVFLAGCSSATDEGGDTEQKLTAEQAKWVAEFVAGVGTTGVNSGATQAPSALAAPEQVAVNQSIDYRYTCTTSGNIHVLGSLTGSISDTGSGLISLGITETLSDCRSRTTSGGWLELNGAPYLSLTGTFSFLNWAPATQQSMSMGGAFMWAFDTGQSGTCQIQLSILFNSATGDGSVTGTVCGYPIAGTLD